VAGEHSSGERLRLDGGEGGSTGNKGSGKEDFGLLITEEKNTAKTCQRFAFNRKYTISSNSELRVANQAFASSTLALT
jgi:hypothetical protein